MKELTIWKDEQFRRMRKDLDRLFRDFFRDFGDPDLAFMAGDLEEPTIDVTEEPEAVVVRMAFPGLDPGDLEIDVAPEVVVITVNRREELVKGAHRLQRDRSFSQRVKLPCRVEPKGAEAVCLDHRLEIRLPKSHTAAFRKIPLRRERK